MDMKARLAAQRAKIAKLKDTLPAEPAAPALPDGWQDMHTTRRGKPVYRVYAICQKQVAKAPWTEQLSELKRAPRQHQPGATCARCHGSGRYSAQLGHFSNEKCFRCNGKGVLDERDVRFLMRREANDEPVCDVASA